ncbi:hypothetical protein FQN54_008529 [Arachnomyces sp. PD_36]|nr:hypothetical protein FQN54_008529 [Arachnomyces sp. PD_36]
MAADNTNLIAVFCLAEIPPNARNSLIDEAYEASSSDVSFTFITSSDPAAPLTVARSPVEHAIKSPGIEACGNAVVQLENSEQSTVDPRYFVVLDKHSLQPERGCIIGGTKGQNYVRCAFGVSRIAVSALRDQKKRWPDLWLDAALSGGVISRPSGGTQSGGYRSFTDREDAKRCFEIHKQREFRNEVPKGDKPYAVFVTADVPVSILNEILIKSESPDDLYGLCFLDTLEPNQQMKTTTAPLPNDFTSPFLGKDFMSILQFVTDVLPNSSLDDTRFLVVDSFSLPSLSSQPSVLLIDPKGHWWDDPEGCDMFEGCFGSRGSFQTAYNCLVVDVGSMDEYASEGAIKGGVYDY